LAADSSLAAITEDDGLLVPGDGVVAAADGDPAGLELGLEELPSTQPATRTDVAAMVASENRDLVTWSLHDSETEHDRRDHEESVVGPPGAVARTALTGGRDG
jgi:hypothetical protein